MPEMSNRAGKLLDSIACFDGHNGFISSAGKELTIQNLRILARLPDRPTPGALEEYLFDLKGLSKMRNGAAQARKLYEEVLAGKRHRVGSRAIPD